MRDEGRGTREFRRPGVIVGTVCIAASILVGACTSRQVYDAGVGWRQNECNQNLDAGERARCLETANKDYDSYRREAGKQ